MLFGVCRRVFTYTCDIRADKANLRAHSPAITLPIFETAAARFFNHFFVFCFFYLLVFLPFCYLGEHQQRIANGPALDGTIYLPDISSGCARFSLSLSLYSGKCSSLKLARGDLLLYTKLLVYACSSSTSYGECVASFN